MNKLIEKVDRMKRYPNTYQSSWNVDYLLKNSLIIIIVVVLVVSVVAIVSQNWDISQGKRSDIPRCPYMWHGGSPSHKGSCWCSGVDEYCLCTPSLAIDAIIEYNPRNIQHPQVCDDCKLVLVVRKDPPRELHAIPGGFVNIGETTEEAVVREAHEETNLQLVSFDQFRLYSDPHRDARRHTVSMVYRCLVSDITKLKSGDDAKAVQAVALKDILSLHLAFDHRKILTDYLTKFHPSFVKVQE
jgi:8-oxo-dGTP diphosphatase